MGFANVEKEENPFSVAVRLHTDLRTCMHAGNMIHVSATGVTLTVPLINSCWQ